MIAEVPGEFGRVIPQPMVRCSQCGRQTLEIDKEDDEPLCSVCRINDRAIGASFAQAAVREIVVPIEIANHGPRPFGLGSGEIGSGRLVESMRRDREIERDSHLCSLLTWGFCVLEGLLLMGAAAMR